MRRALLVGLGLLAGCGEAERAVAPRAGVDPALTRPGQGELPRGEPARVRDPLPAGATGVAGLDGRGGVRPRRLAIAEDAELERLRWSTWGGARAEGRGRLAVLGCNPDCASGVVRTVTARVRLSGPVDCAEGRFYDRAVVEIDGRDPATFIQAPC